VNGCGRCFNGGVRALGLGLTVALALAACARPAATADDSFAAARARMVADTIASRDVKDARVLAAMRKVPRHEFVPANVRGRAYDDAPVPIGHGQTASQPYIVAVMTELAELGPDSRVLEIGTGSGYQAAVLAECAGEVWSIELLEPLATSARRTLERLGYGRVHVRQGDGYRGWPEAAPFDAIVVTAAPPEVPKALLDQLAMGGRLVVPVGTDEQELEVHRRTAEGIRVKKVLPVTFVPMVPGRQEEGR
jgi:protein-L-isoaspartate(D-aspartate) O-methyltransferase